MERGQHSPYETNEARIKRLDAKNKQIKKAEARIPRFETKKPETTLDASVKKELERHNQELITLESERAQKIAKGEDTTDVTGKIEAKKRTIEIVKDL